MTATAYTIRLVDQASASAAKVQASLAAVAAAATRTERAFMGTDRAYRAVAGEAERQARAQLKVARALATVDRQAVAHQRQMDRFGRIRNGGKQMIRGREREKETFGQVAGALGLFVGALSAATFGVARMGRDLLESAGDAQTFERAFNRLTGDPAELQRTRTLIQKLGLDLVEGEKAALRLRSSFGEIDTQGFLKFFRTMGLDKVQTDSVSRAIGQIQGLNKVQGDELNEVTQAVPGLSRKKIYEEFGRIRGIDPGQAQKVMGQEGSATDAIRAITAAALNTRGAADQTGSFDAEGRVKLGGADSAIAESAGDINQRLQAFDNSVTKLQRTLGAGLVEAGVLEDLERLTVALEKIAAMDLGATFRKWFGDGGTKEKPGGGFAEASGANDVKAVGEALGAGLATGIEASKGQAEAAINNVASGVISQSRSAFGIHSPSKVFAEQGHDVVAGLEKGVDDNQDLALGAAESLADGTIAEAEMAAATGSGVSSGHMANVGAAAGNALGASSGSGGPVSVSVSITVDGAQGPAETVEQIREYFSTADFASLFERAVEGSGA